MKNKEFGIDPKCISLIGISTEGCLTDRAVAFESRAFVVILYDGIYDGYDSKKSGFPKSLLDAIEEGNSDFVNMTLNILMESNSNIKFNVKHGGWTTGASSPYELIIGSNK
jgi:hypothetical protein